MAEAMRLTEPNPELARQQRATPPGMAFWSGTGPEGTKCGGCRHYGYEYTSAGGKAYRKSSSCALFRKMSHSHGATLDTSQASCKYFVAKLSA